MIAKRKPVRKGDGFINNFVVEGQAVALLERDSPVDEAEQRYSQRPHVHSLYNIMK